MWMQQRGNLGSYFQYLLSARSNDNGPIQNATIDVYKPNEASNSATASSSTVHLCCEMHCGGKLAD